MSAAEPFQTRFRSYRRYLVPMNSQTEKLSLQGAAGAIEVQRDQPADTPRGIAVIAHPHPLFGGTMDNKVVQTLARAFVACGWTTVRFNFRGVGASEGVHDEGRGELEDMLHVVGQLAPKARSPSPAFPSAPSWQVARPTSCGASASCSRSCWSAPPPRATRWQRCRSRRTSERWSSTAKPTTRWRCPR
jgi:hypothetical protein